MVDCKTDWPDIIEMGKDTTASKLISVRDHFCRTAAPDLLWSDGGPQFTSSQLADFLKTWGVRHSRSSPHYPQSNGKVEATVKSMKKLISAAWSGRSVNWNKLSPALLQYRNTPSRKDGMSPAQKLFGHPVQDSLPAHQRSFMAEWQKSSDTVDKALSSTQAKSEAYYNQQAHDLPDLQVGNHVAIQDPDSKLWDVYGVVTAIGPYRRYFVKTQSGRVFVRNHRFLRKQIAVSIATPEGGPAPPSDPPAQLNPPQPPNNPPTQINPPQPRWSTRKTQPPKYLSQDPTWLFSSSVNVSSELGGEV